MQTKEPVQKPACAEVRRAVPEEISCPACGYEIEVWSDEDEVVCTLCKRTLIRNKEVGVWQVKS